MSQSEQAPKQAVTYLGWANGWLEVPEIVRRCNEQGHTHSYVDRTHGRGLDNEVRCDICGYVYHYDSSG